MGLHVNLIIEIALNVNSETGSHLISTFQKTKQPNLGKMNMAQLSALNLDEIQILAAAAAAANATQLAAAQQASVSQSVSNSVASISRQSHHGTSGHNNSSRQATPPVTPGTSNTNTPKASASSTRTPTPTQNGISVHANNLGSANATTAAQLAALDPQSQSKYQQLLSVIEEMSKDIRPTYAGSKSSAERLKRGIVYARILVRECLVETERSARS